jgi:hypothetical protein
MIQYCYTTDEVLDRDNLTVKLTGIFYRLFGENLCIERFVSKIIKTSYIKCDSLGNLLIHKI